MKNKIIKSISLTMGCLMLALVVSTNIIHKPTTTSTSRTQIHVDMDSPEG